MKNPASKLTLIIGLFALGVLAATAIAAERRDEAPAKSEKAKQDAENLKKYDKNGNGKLDPDEEAAMKADQAKAKRKKEG